MDAEHHAYYNKHLASVGKNQWPTFLPLKPEYLIQVQETVVCMCNEWNE